MKIIASTLLAMASKNVRVGVGVIVKDPLKPTHVFAGIRRGSHGEGWFYV